MLGSFFCDYHSARPDLHSFPTRRSSDLDFQRNRTGFGECRPSHANLGFTPTSACRGSWGLAWLGRSEEHTSELQSLRHLVCRLLLEKKKQTTIFRSPGPRRR